jgi:hypothetical protein
MRRFDAEKRGWSLMRGAHAVCVCVCVCVLGALFAQVPFDIFDRRYRDSWNAVMARFRKSVEEIENMTKSFIRQSFQKLRSAEVRHHTHTSTHTLTQHTFHTDTNAMRCRG